MMTRIDRLLSLGAALVAAALLLVVYPAHRTPPPAAPVPATLAWPHAQSATVGALPDGMPYQPGIFLDARTSVGTAPDPTHQFLRLMVRGGDSSVRLLRSLPMRQLPWFGGLTVAGDVLAWAESADGEHLQMWTVNLRDGQPARELTADTGDAILSGSPYDLQIADGRLHWAVSDLDHSDITEIRSVALTGDAVDVRSEAGSWELSVWPWLVNGRDDPRGATTVRNLATNRVFAVPRSDRQTTRCSPTWCQTVAPSAAGFRVELRHPDGTATLLVTDGAALPAIANVAPLDRFEVLSQLGAYSGLTGTKQLLVFDIATRRTVEVSPAARTVSCNGGVLWWSTGASDAPVWHAIDLRTV